MDTIDAHAGQKLVQGKYNCSITQLLTFFQVGKNCGSVNIRREPYITKCTSGTTLQDLNREAFQSFLAIISN